MSDDDYEDDFDSSSIAASIQNTPPSFTPQNAPLQQPIKQSNDLSNNLSNIQQQHHNEASYQLDDQSSYQPSNRSNSPPIRQTTQSPVKPLNNQTVRTTRTTFRSSSTNISNKENTNERTINQSIKQSINPLRHVPSTSISRRPISQSKSSINQTNRNQPHHYRVSIDIRSIYDLALPISQSNNQASGTYVHFEYTYPMLASHAIVSQPATFIPYRPNNQSVNQSINLSNKVDCVNAFHLFEFVVSPYQLINQTVKQPLVIQLIDQSIEVGRMIISLHTLYQAVNQSKPDGQSVKVIDQTAFIYRRLNVANKMEINGQSINQSINCLDDHQARTAQLQKIGRGRVVMTLEDFGPINESSNPSNQSVNQMTTSSLPQETVQQPVNQPVSQASPPPVTAAAEPVASNTHAFPMPPPLSQPVNQSNNQSINQSTDRSSAEYQVAWELEVWRRAQQAQYESQAREILQKARETEQKRMVDLESEWRAQVRKQELAFATKQQHLASLEAKLITALSEASSAEKSLAQKQAELDQKIALDQSINQSTNQSIKQEAELAIQRMRDYHSHTAAMSKRIIGDMQGQLEAMRSKLVAEEARYRQLEDQYSKMKQSISKSSIGEARLMLAEKEMQINALHAKIESINQTNEQLTKDLQRSNQTIKELNNQISSLQAADLLNERRALMQLKSEVQSRARSSGIKRDKDELEDIRKKLKEVVAEDQSINPFSNQSKNQAISQANHQAERELNQSVNRSINQTIHPLGPPPPLNLPTFYDQADQVSLVDISSNQSVDQSIDQQSVNRRPLTPSASNQLNVEDLASNQSISQPRMYVQYPQSIDHSNNQSNPQSNYQSHMGSPSQPARMQEYASYHPANQPTSQQIYDEYQKTVPSAHTRAMQAMTQTNRQAIHQTIAQSDNQTTNHALYQNDDDQYYQSPDQSNNQSNSQSNLQSPHQEDRHLNHQFINRPENQSNQYADYGADEAQDFQSAPRVNDSTNVQPSTDSASHNPAIRQVHAFPETSRTLKSKRQSTSQTNNQRRHSVDLSPRRSVSQSNNQSTAPPSLSPRSAQRLAQRRSAEAARLLANQTVEQSKHEQAVRQSISRRRMAWKQESKRERTHLTNHFQPLASNQSHRQQLIPHVHRVKGHGVVPVIDRSTHMSKQGSPSNNQSNHQSNNLFSRQSIDQSNNQSNDRYDDQLHLTDLDDETPRIQTPPVPMSISQSSNQPINQSSNRTNNQLPSSSSFVPYQRVQ